MPGEYKKLITSGSIAELKSLISDGNLIVSGSQIILKGLPTAATDLPAGRLWNYIDDGGNSFLRVSDGNQ
tara:strand:+ start:414 stop:623 length:210 start_codon:yes stop_codon:yes gene_type:complete